MRTDPSEVVLSLVDADAPSAADGFCTLAEFLEANRDDAWVCEEVGNLRPGESVYVGGGAAPRILIRRVR